MCMVYYLHVRLHHMGAWYPQRLEEGIKAFGTDCCESSCRCWESNLGPLEEQSALITTESPLHPIFLNSENCELNTNLEVSSNKVDLQSSFNT